MTISAKEFVESPSIEVPETYVKKVMLQITQELQLEMKRSTRKDELKMLIVQQLVIQHSSVCLHLAVLDASNFDVHHSSTLNCMCLWLCPSFLKWYDTGVIYPSFWPDTVHISIF